MDSKIPRVSGLVLRVVENQLSDNKPEEARQAFERLTIAGFSEEDAKHLIGSVIAAEMRKAVETSKPFSGERYAELLKMLPALPGEGA